MAPINATSTQKIVGERLRLLRAQKTLNQAADEAGVSPETLAKIEDGKSNFRILTITKLCTYYRVTLEDLMNDPIAGSPGKASLSWKQAGLKADIQLLKDNPNLNIDEKYSP